MGTMTAAPVCRLCGASHWLREPHMFVTDLKTIKPVGPIVESTVESVPTIEDNTPPPSKNPLTLARIAIDATKRLKVAQDLLARLRAGEKVSPTPAERKRKSRARLKLKPKYQKGRTNAQRQKAYRERLKQG